MGSERSTRGWRAARRTRRSKEIAHCKKPTHVYSSSINEFPFLRWLPARPPAPCAPRGRHAPCRGGCCDSGVAALGGAGPGRCRCSARSRAGLRLITSPGGLRWAPSPKGTGKGRGWAGGFPVRTAGKTADSFTPRQNLYVSPANILRDISIPERVRLRCTSHGTARAGGKELASPSTEGMDSQGLRARICTEPCQILPRRLFPVLCTSGGSRAAEGSLVRRKRAVFRALRDGRDQAEEAKRREGIGNLQKQFGIQNPCVHRGE